MSLNPTRPFMGIIAILVVVYLIFTMMSSDPLTRMNRLCRPVTLWPGHVATAAVRIADAKDAASTNHFFEGGFYTCRRFIWDAFYRSDYLKMERARAKSHAQHTKNAAVASASSAAGEPR